MSLNERRLTFYLEMLRLDFQVRLKHLGLTELGPTELVDMVSRFAFILSATFIGAGLLSFLNLFDHHHMVSIR